MWKHFVENRTPQSIKIKKKSKPTPITQVGFFISNLRRETYELKFSRNTEFSLVGNGMSSGGNAVEIQDLDTRTRAKIEATTPVANCENSDLDQNQQLLFRNPIQVIF